MDKVDHMEELATKKANKAFFDAIASIYELVDCRRTESITGWVKDILKTLHNETNGMSLLDLGCGTGLILGYSRGIFDIKYGIDLSVKVLKKTCNVANGAICGDIMALPFRDATFDVASCFAVLHHCHNFLPLFREVHRILKLGGIFYSDHDLDLTFVSRYLWVIRLFRRFFGIEKRYMENTGVVNLSLYKQSEVWYEGLDSVELVRLLRGVGFRKIDVRFHWLGLDRHINMVLGRRTYPRGIAPLLSIIARK